MMERLTKRINGVVTYIGKENSSDTGQIAAELNVAARREILERLAAYEDTGLTPESVETLKLSMMGKTISEITEFEGLPIERLKELARADREGCVVLQPSGVPTAAAH